MLWYNQTDFNPVLVDFGLDFLIVLHTCNLDQKDFEPSQCARFFGLVFLKQY